MNQDFSAATRFLTPESFMVPEWLPPVSAWYEHGSFASWLMATQRPASFVELGSHWGFSYFAFCQSAQKNKILVRCHAVDTWQGDEHAGNYGQNVFAAVSAQNQKHYAGFSQLIRTTFEAAAETFANGSIDLLHIDGLHTYAAVKHDFLTWLPKMSPRGVVLFHDSNVRERDFGVWQLWAELTPQYPHFEFLHGHGLGVLAVGHEVAPELQALCAVPAGSETAAQIQNFYAQLGANISVRAQLLAAEKRLARPWPQRLRERVARSLGR